MKIYLARHGSALLKEKNAQSPLSDGGRKDVEYIAEFVSHLNSKVAHIFHSGKLRAKETAEILAKAFMYEGLIEARKGLDPLDEVGPIASELYQADADILLVGHMPFMGKLAAKLVTGNEDDDIVLFQTGTLVCLQQTGGNNFIVEWIIAPELYT